MEGIDRKELRGEFDVLLTVLDKIDELVREQNETMKKLERINNYMVTHQHIGCE